MKKIKIKTKKTMRDYLHLLISVRKNMSAKNRGLEKIINIGMLSAKRCSVLLIIAFAITTVVRWFVNRPNSFLDTVTYLLGTGAIISISITCATILFFGVCACMNYAHYVLCISFKEIPMFLLVYIAYAFSSKSNRKRIKRDMERYFVSTRQKRLALKQNSIEKHTIYVCQMLCLVSKLKKEVF